MKTESGWQSFRRTKAYDLLAGSPLLAWYAFGLWSYYPKLSAAIALRRAQPNVLHALVAVNLMTAGALTLLLLLLVLVRKVPIGRSRGPWPRITAFLGSNLVVGFALLPTAHLSLPWQALSTVLSLIGTAGAIGVVLWLRRAFSLMPEARVLQMRGPYGAVRHPLYLMEMTASLGLMLQFAQPWSVLLAAAILALQFLRMHYEEQVLAQNFPDYRAYTERTARFLPGVY